MRIRGTGCLYQPRYRGRGGEVKTAGIWHWKAPTGQRYTTGCREKKAAQKWALARLAEMHPVPSVAPCRYDDLERCLLDDWSAKGRKGIAQATARLRHLRRSFSGWDASAITTDKVMAFALARRRQGAAAATVNLEIALLHRAFTLAKRAGLVRDVPIMDRLPGAVHRTGVIERGDFEAILDAIPGRYVPLLRFLHITGWREGEGISLRWDCVDETAGELRLAPEQSKTGRERIFPYAASATLAALLEGQRRLREFSPFVFPGRAGAPIDRTALQKTWRRACASVGVPKALIHDLRRTAARDLRRADVSPFVAMAQLGHADPGTHQDYSVVLRQDRAEAVRRLEALREAEPRIRSMSRIG